MLRRCLHLQLDVTSFTDTNAVGQKNDIHIFPAAGTCRSYRWHLIEPGANVAPGNLHFLKKSETRLGLVSVETQADGSPLCITLRWASTISAEKHST